ncbi:nuclear transport factor 2 family protein [Primorskyibacter sp. S87]|uniref:nuclear transport factor 2 family protein n=1 Tax=Primorskyibacter sp. S87 TaxID=3415126 RepID=UPI003C7CBBE7
MDQTRSDRIRQYFQALTDGDTETILSLFAPDGEVHSPFLGVMRADAFFAKLSDASAGSHLTVLDVLHGEETGAARFQYDWTLKDGNVIDFEGVDHFTFAADGRFSAMRIYYDTHPLREAVGDKYA